MLRRKPKETGPVSWIRKKINKCKRLTWGCRIAIFGAGAFSIWANVLHARPGTVPLVIAAAPPLLVLAGWEMVSRVPLRADTGWFKRFVRPTATGLIAAGAAWLSYWHQRGAVIMYSGDEQTGSILPGLVDGLLVIASVTVMELNLMVADLEAREHGQQVLRTTPPGTPVKTMRTVSSTITKKERVAQLRNQHPEMGVKEIADAVGASYGYVYQLVQELEKAGGAELVRS